MNYTPLELRDWADMIADPEYGYRKPKISDIQDQLHAHAAALEEIERRKVEVAARTTDCINWERLYNAANEHAADADERAERAEAEVAKLKALLLEARESWIKVGYGASHEDVAECIDFCARIDAAIDAARKP